MFKEQEHPRDKDGRFTSKGGGAYHYDPKNYEDPVSRNSFREVAHAVSKDIGQQLLDEKPRLREHIEKNGAVLDGYGGTESRTEAFKQLLADRLTNNTSDRDTMDMHQYSFRGMHAVKPELTEFLHSTLNKTAHWMEHFENAEKQMAQHHPVYFGSSAIGSTNLDLSGIKEKGLDGDIGEVPEVVRDRVHLYKSGVQENGTSTYMGLDQAHELYGVRNTQHIAKFLGNHSEEGKKSFSLNNGRVGFDVHVTHYRQRDGKSLPDYIQAKVDIKTARSTIKGARLVFERIKQGNAPSKKQRAVGYSGSGWHYTGGYNIKFDFPRTSMNYKGEKYFPYKHVDVSTKDNILKTAKLLLHQMDGGKEAPSSPGRGLPK